MNRVQKLYYEMLRIRKVEEEIAKRYKEGEIRCPVHLSIGQEAAAVGIASLLKPDDMMVSTHRGHAHYLAKGGNLNGLLCELYGKKAGCSRGQGGSMHLVDWSVNFAGSTSIVGGTIPVGCGLAFAKKIKGDPGIVVICIGDAAVEEGVFHEAANFVALHNLPVLFVLENNLYSCFTHLNKRQPSELFQRFADANYLFYKRLNGNDAYQMTYTTDYVRVVREENRPALLELETYRHLQHCGVENDDNLGYRDPREIKRWMALDPIKCLKKRITERGEWTEGFEDGLKEIDVEIKAAFEYAKAAEFPPLSDLGSLEYA